MNLSELASVRIESLVTELCRRIRRLQTDAARVGSIGTVRDLLTSAIDAGRSAGRADILRQLEQRIVAVLDEATANTPPPLAEDATAEQRLLQVRDARRALWQAIEKFRGQVRAEADVEHEVALKARAWLERRAAEVLAPAPSLRARVGQWLILASSRLAQRGAA